MDAKYRKSVEETIPLLLGWIQYRVKFYGPIRGYSPLTDALDRLQQWLINDDDGFSTFDGWTDAMEFTLDTIAAFREYDTERREGRNRKGAA